MRPLYGNEDQFPMPNPAPIAPGPYDPATVQRSKLAAMLSSVAAGAGAWEPPPPPQLSGVQTSPIADVLNSLGRGLKQYDASRQAAQQNSMQQQQMQTVQRVQNSPLAKAFWQKFMSGDMKGVTPEMEAAGRVLAPFIQVPNQSYTQRGQAANVKGGLAVDENTRASLENADKMQRDRLAQEEKQRAMMEKYYTDQTNIRNKELGLEGTKNNLLARQLAQQQRQLASEIYGTFVPDSDSALAPQQREIARYAAEVIADPNFKGDVKDLQKRLEDTGIAGAWNIFTSIPGIKEYGMDVAMRKAQAAADNTHRDMRNAPLYGLIMAKTGASNIDDALKIASEQDPEFMVNVQTLVDPTAASKFANNSQFRSQYNAASKLVAERLGVDQKTWGSIVADLTTNKANKEPFRIHPPEAGPATPAKGAATPTPGAATPAPQENPVVTQAKQGLKIILDAYPNPASAPPDIIKKAQQLQAIINAGGQVQQ